MSGLAGLFGGASPAALRRLARPLDGRGPGARWEGLHEGTGFVVVRSGPAEDGPAVAVVHGRLVAVAGHALNRLALAREFSLPDTSGVAEVFGEIVEFVGPERAASRLTGCLAFAVWDPTSGERFLQRDASGLRPLEVVATADGFAFATEGRSLALAGQAGEREPAAVAEAVRAGAPRAPGGYWRGVERLPAGGTWSARGAQAPLRDAPARPAPHPAGAGGNAERWLRSVRYGLELAAVGRMRAAGTTAIALSSGLASAALLACRAPGAVPELALVLDGPEATLADSRAAALGVRTRRVSLAGEAFAELLDELPMSPAFLQPEAWMWAALARAAWQEGATGLLAGCGAGPGFDPAPAGVRAGLRAFLPRPAAARQGPPGAPLANDAPAEPMDPWTELAEVDLAALDAGASAFGVAPLAPFADPAVLAVARQVPVGVHHGGGRRALLAAIASAGGVAAVPQAPQRPALPLADWLAQLDPDGLPEALGHTLDPEHVRAVVAGGRAGEPAMLRRAVVYGLLARLA